MGKFARVVMGDVGQSGDETLHKDLLDVLGLTQPFHPGDEQLLEFIRAAKGIEPEVATRGLRTLIRRSRV